MKKLLTTLLGICLVIISISFGFSQNQFEGEITFDVEIENLSQPEMENFLPNKFVVSLKDKKSHIIQYIGTAGSQNTIVYDYENKMGYVAMNMMGQKILINIDRESFENNLEESKEAEVEYYDEYKTILGYKCQKADLKMEAGSMTVYCTEEIPAYMNQEMTNLKGMPLEYSMNQNGMSMKMKATSVNEKNIDNDIFMKPSGYNEMSLEEFKNMAGGNFKF